jgi:uncharacterized membrane protein YjgN (DUF898 family)
MYSQSSFLNERFAYHGTGMELFIGWIKAFFIFGSIYALIVALSFYVNENFFLLIYLFFLALMPFAKISVRRYKLSRTSWSSIRFSFRGRYKAGIKLFAVGTILSILTIGLYKPFFHCVMQKYFRENSFYGDTRFSYDGEGWYLMKDLLLAIFFTPFTLGLIWLNYHAKVYRYDWEHTKFEGLSFRSTATGWNFFCLYLGNFIVMILTLGFGLPFIMTRIIKFHYRHLKISGLLDLHGIRQDAKSALSTGEGIADFIELDAGLF